MAKQEFCEFAGICPRYCEGRRGCWVGNALGSSGLVSFFTGKRARSRLASQNSLGTKSVDRYGWALSEDRAAHDFGADGRE